MYAPVYRVYKGILTFSLHYLLSSRDRNSMQAYGVTHRCVQQSAIAIRSHFSYNTHAQRHICVFILSRHAHKPNFLPQLKCSRLWNKN